MASSDPKYVKIVKDDFNVLSKSYDKINNFMSLGVDQQFRYIAIKNTYPEITVSPSLITWIDFGTGTGHLANELYRQKPGIYVVGLDVSFAMINHVKEREIYQAGNMSILLGDVSRTPFRKASVDGAFSGFVGRHFTNYSLTLEEHHRVIRSKGRLMMLEMGRKASPLAFIIDFYVGKVMSAFGKIAAYIITRGGAPFRLLEETYNRFYSPEELVNFYEQAGFKTRYKLVLLGSIVIILAYRTPEK